MVTMHRSRGRTLCPARGALWFMWRTCRSPKHSSKGFSTRLLLAYYVHWCYHYCRIMWKLQTHAPTIRQPQCELTSICSPWPFYERGINLVGPVHEAPGRVKFLIIAVDYFTKWVEAERLATITCQKVVKFVYHNIACRFGIPGIIIRDNDKQFSNNPFKSWCNELKNKIEIHLRCAPTSKWTNGSYKSYFDSRFENTSGQSQRLMGWRIT